MLSQLFRSLNRQTFKSIQSHSYLKRFYSNQDINEKSSTEENNSSKKCHNFSDFEDYSKLYHEYYKRYYDNFKFETKQSTGRQTDNNDRKHSKDSNNNEKFNSNSYSFSECKYHLLTLKLLEKIGYIGAAIVVGVHFESPFYTRRYGIRSNCNIERLDVTPNYGNCSTTICGNCKTCKALFSKLWVLSAPIRSIRNNNVLPKTNDRFISFDKRLNDFSQSTEDLNQNRELNETTDDLNSNEIALKIKETSDPIDEICRQLQSASIDYIDRLNNMLGIALIQSDPQEAMRCWSGIKNNPKALFNMGVAFESGRHSADGTVDLERAHQHYVLSASLGHKEAIYNLSLFYLYGKGGISVDLSRAELLLKRAAKMGVKAAQQFIQELELKRSTRMKQKTVMRSSASAPNLTTFSTCFESYSNENPQKYQQNYSISNRV